MKSSSRRNKWSINGIITGLFLLVYSCGNPVEESYEVIFPLEQDNNSFSVKITKTIALSNEREAIIGKIDKLILYSDRIYILDKRAVSGVLIFSQEGEFLHKSRLGKGPGELIHPQDFNIVNGQLVISDQNFIKYYNLDGEYLSSMTLSDNIMGIWSFEPLDNERLFIHGITKPKMKDGIPIAQPFHVIKDDFSECYESF